MKLILAKKERILYQENRAPRLNTGVLVKKLMRIY
jgi:hypothetical protein